MAVSPDGFVAGINHEALVERLDRLPSMLAGFFDAPTSEKEESP